MKQTEANNFRSSYLHKWTGPSEQLNVCLNIARVNVDHNPRSIFWSVTFKFRFWFLPLLQFHSVNDTFHFNYCHIELCVAVYVFLWHTISILFLIACCGPYLVVFYSSYEQKCVIVVSVGIKDWCQVDSQVKLGTGLFFLLNATLLT